MSVFASQLIAFLLTTRYITLFHLLPVLQLFVLRDKSQLMATNCFMTASGADTLKSGKMLRNSLISSVSFFFVFFFF